MTGVCTPGARNRSAHVRCETSWVVSKKPLADAPRACTTRSGMRSRSNCGEGGVGGMPRAPPSPPLLLSLSLSHVGQLFDEVVVLEQNGAWEGGREAARRRGHGPPRAPRPPPPSRHPPAPSHRPSSSHRARRRWTSCCCSTRALRSSWSSARSRGATTGAAGRGERGVVRRVRGWERGGGPSRRRGARQRGDGHARARASGAALPAPAPGAPVPTPGGDPGAGRVARAARRIRSRRVSSGAGAPKWRGGQRPPSLSLTHLGVHGGVLWGGWEAPAAERQRGSGATAANGGAHTRARRPPPRRPPSVIESGRGSAPARWRASKRGAARFCAAACRQDGGERPRQLLKRCADAHGAGRGSDWGGRGRAAPRARIRATAPPSPLARRPNHTRPARPAPHRLAR